jgi:RimJ/RimL family protein N-acetyltransferase
MRQVLKSEFSRILPSVAQIPCFRAFAASVLELRAPGKVFALSDRLFLICWQGGCYVLCGQSCSMEDEAAMMRVLFSGILHFASDLGLYPWIDGSPGVFAFGNLPDAVKYSRCLVYTEHAMRVPRGYSSTWRCAGMTVRAISGLDFDRPLVREDILLKWENPEQFLANGFGFIATQEQGEIGGFCYSGAIGAGLVEVSIKVCELFRRHSIGTVLGTKLCEECYTRGLRPVWTCMKENIPSVKLAERLGFACGKEHPFYFWRMTSSEQGKA